MTIHVDYWSDPLCIWAYVAQGRHERLLANHGDRLNVHTRIVPVFGSVPYRFREGGWAAKGVEGRVEVTQRVAREHGESEIEVTGEVWRTDPPATTWAPSAAIKAATLAIEAGELPEGSDAQLLTALRNAFFEQNVNIARRSAQLEAAEALGLDRAPLETRLDDGQAIAALWEDHLYRMSHHVQGSPTYVFDGGRAMIYGNYNEEVLESTVDALIRGEDPGGSRC